MEDGDGASGPCLSWIFDAVGYPPRSCRRGGWRGAATSCEKSKFAPPQTSAPRNCRAGTQRMSFCTKSRLPSSTTWYAQEIRRRSRKYSAARNLGYTFARAASFAGKALGLAGHAASPRPSPRTHACVAGTRPRGAGRRPSSDSPPDCAVPGDLSPILRTAQYVRPEHRRSFAVEVQSISQCNCSMKISVRHEGYIPESVMRSPIGGGSGPHAQEPWSSVQPSRHRSSCTPVRPARRTRCATPSGALLLAAG